MTPYKKNILKQRLIQVYHTGSTRIEMWEMLDWFNRDGGKITKALFRDEVFPLWSEIWESDDEVPELAVLRVYADHTVVKPTAYIIFQKSYLFLGESSED
jgi:hypothetical protein